MACSNPDKLPARRGVLANPTNCDVLQFLRARPGIRFDALTIGLALKLTPLQAKWALHDLSRARLIKRTGCLWQAKEVPL